MLSNGFMDDENMRNLRGFFAKLTSIINIKSEFQNKNLFKKFVIIKNCCGKISNWCSNNNKRLNYIFEDFGLIVI